MMPAGQHVQSGSIPAPPHYTHYQTRQRIRDEHDGEPLREILRGYARLSVSQATAAGAMGIQPKTLRRYCRRWGIAWPGRGEQREPWGGRHYTARRTA